LKNVSRVPSEITWNSVFRHINTKLKYILKIIYVIDWYYPINYINFFFCTFLGLVKWDEKLLKKNPFDARRSTLLLYGYPTMFSYLSTTEKHAYVIFNIDCNKNKRRWSFHRSRHRLQLKNATGQFYGNHISCYPVLCPVPYSIISDVHIHTQEITMKKPYYKYVCVGKCNT